MTTIGCQGKRIGSWGLTYESRWAVVLAILSHSAVKQASSSQNRRFGLETCGHQMLRDTPVLSTRMRYATHRCAAASSRSIADASTWPGGGPDRRQVSRRDRRRWRQLVRTVRKLDYASRRLGSPSEHTRKQRSRIGAHMSTRARVRRLKKPKSPFSPSERSHYRGVSGCLTPLSFLGWSIPSGLPRA